LRNYIKGWLYGRKSFNNVKCYVQELQKFKFLRQKMLNCNFIYWNITLCSKKFRNLTFCIKKFKDLTSCSEKFQISNPLHQRTHQQILHLHVCPSASSNP
jgi:hypothetical protein